MKKVICMGSGKNMVLVNEWDTEGITICGVNNTWRGTDKWDVLLHAGDYPYKQEVRKAKSRPEQEIVSREGDRGFKNSYVAMSPNMRWEEARIHLGLPIYFTMTYWALHYLKPDALGFIGFDMNYTPGPEGETTFYGKGFDMQKRGVPDPLYQFRTVPEYKAHGDAMMGILMDRLQRRAYRVNMVNLSDDPTSILPWKQMSFDEFKEL
jgi:hypothetical protein